MKLFRREQRASIESPTVPISNKNILSFLGLNDLSVAGEPVTIDSALGVPAIWSSVNFLSGTIASLPIHLYRRKAEGRERVRSGIAPLVSGAVNDETSSFEWRKHLFDRVFTGGRGLSFIERNAAGTPINIWPLDPRQTTISRNAQRKVYRYKDGSRTVEYEASEIIDVPFMLESDMLKARSPIFSNAQVISLAQAATRYGGRFFGNGGIPPFAIEGPFQSAGGMKRAVDDLVRAAEKAAEQNKPAIALPEGHKIHQIGVDPEKSQLVELQRFLVEQVARIYSLPPVFLQDLTHGTFSNTEQQDLHFVKHTLRRWVTQFEQELNLKLLGRRSRSMFIEVNLEAILRGDFKARMEGYSAAIQNAVMKPNEARRRENLPDDDDGEKLMIQGGTMPVAQQRAAEGDNGE